MPYSAIQQHTAANARTNGNAERRFRSLRCPEPELPKSGTVHIIFYRTGQLTGALHKLPEPCPRITGDTLSCIDDPALFRINDSSRRNSNPGHLMELTIAIHNRKDFFLDSFCPLFPGLCIHRTFHGKGSLFICQTIFDGGTAYINTYILLHSLHSP